MPSLKQIGTICFLSIISISPTFADNETPSYITNASNCNQGVLQTDTGPAALEANYSANRINTTWYSDGTALSGNGVPSSCTYDAALVPPTPDSRPGYAFGGWKIKRCEIPSTDVSTNCNAYAAKRLSGGTDSTDGGATAATYGLEQPGEWGVSWENGDKVTGVALCSQTSGTYLNTGTPDETGNGETQYCWCKATHYTANNAQQCSLSSPSWVFKNRLAPAADCAFNCAFNCADLVKVRSGFRAALFGGNVAQ